MVGGIFMKLQELIFEYIEKRGDDWVVLNHIKQKVLGKHNSKKKALAQLRAIEINKHK